MGLVIFSGFIERSAMAKLWDHRPEVMQDDNLQERYNQCQLDGLDAAASVRRTERSEVHAVADATESPGLRL